MRLVTLADSGDLGIIRDGQVVPASALGPGVPTTMSELLARGPEAMTALTVASATLAAEGEPLADLLARDGLAAPVAPRQIIGVGRNYREHASEQGLVPPETPLLFAKLASSLAAPGSTISWDAQVATQVDYEAELGVVIGRTTRDVAVPDALDAVFGYCCVNDVTARDLQRSDGQWLRAKGSDTFCPIGPWILTADEVPDPQALDVTCTVNGEVRQSGSTADMFFGVAELVAHISRSVTLQPGDLIATGTPGGVGMFRDPPALLGDGDEVVVEVAGLGRLVNRCAPR